MPTNDPERQRLAAIPNGEPWRLWGPYLSDRQWSTVREDYSPDGDAWGYFPHDHARSRAYRWGEDGLLGISDDHGDLCFALALWNGNDPFLKERLFGVTGSQGNHGEDVKEYYFYLDSTPTHSYMKALYKYPQRAFPYDDLVTRNQSRSRAEPEFELIDTGAFDDDRYFDVSVEYAKAGPKDIVIKITAINRGAEAAPLHILPTLWFRNTWSWGRDDRRPQIREAHPLPDGHHLLHATQHNLGDYWLAAQHGANMHDTGPLFTENETNAQRLWATPNNQPFVKDAFHEAVVSGNANATNPDRSGTKASLHYQVTLMPGATETILLRLSSGRLAEPLADAEAIVAQRKAEADAFYAPLEPEHMPEDARLVRRQAFAGLMWSKQFYNFEVADWLDGDPAFPPPPPERLNGRNKDWRHFNSSDILLMPDKWEYPWFAAWDLAFHCMPAAAIDPEFAKEQLIVLLREWYMHPNGQVPAYEWAFGDVNPPVLASAAWQVYLIEKKTTGKGDRAFLERTFHKMLLNFTWWVNRKDSEGNNVFGGGFLGLDNIGVFDRSQPLPTGGDLEQADGTAWMGMFCLTMLGIAVELSLENPVYEDIATKFFEHFMYIAGALNDVGGDGLWDEEDEFFYDMVHLPDGTKGPMRIRTLVGLIPLLAVAVIEPAALEKLPDFRARLEWFLKNRPDLASLVSRWDDAGSGERRLLSLVRGHRMKRLLKRMLHPEEFLSDYGIRSISRHHLEHPYVLEVDGNRYEVKYEPAESSTPLFGGNSNWRGPIWFPINYIIIRALERYHTYYGDDFLVEHPTGSGQMHTLHEVAQDLSHRLNTIFLRDEQGRRAVFGGTEKFQHDPHWRDLVPFHEYFHGDNGAGIGASHQTGWTALVALRLDEKSGGLFAGL